MGALDNPAYSREMQRLADPGEPPEYIAWLRKFGESIMHAWATAPEDMDREFYNALQAAADAVAKAEERGYRENWL